jgi:eukaryotic-like serine/threonine-protein kinase
MTAITERLSAALAGRYRIERHLGEGGMASVYLAEDLKHDRKVAVKVLKPELAAVLGAERFVQEIKTTASLQHPHILPLFDSGTADGFLFYVMPFIKGETLRDKLNRETQFGVDEAVRIAREVADALDYAHRSGVIHRDIKPENILLHDGRPMVADFGIALAVSAAAGGRMTETGLSLGTPHYMSPEQATADKEITGRSDVYSLASVLYEMLAGNPPHVGSSAQQIIMKIIAEPVDPVTRYRKSVPPNVSAALTKALEKLPADRFASASEFARALGDVAFRGDAATGSVAAGSARRGLRVWQLAAAAVVALAAGVAIGIAVGGSEADPLQVVRFSAPTRSSNRLFNNFLFETPFALSPDGTQMVFVAFDSGASMARLHIRRMDQLTSTPLVGTEDAVNPFFSPDGREIGFITQKNLTLKKIAATGGPVSTILTGVRVRFGAPSWGDDGSIIYTNGVNQLSRIAVPGEKPASLTDSTTFRFSGSPVILPGSRALLLTGVSTSTPSAPNIGELYVMEIATRKAKRLVENARRGWYLPGGYLVYATDDGALFGVRFDLGTLEISGTPVALLDGIMAGLGGRARVAVASQSGTMAYLPGSASDDAVIVQVDHTGREQVILAKPAPYSVPRISHDGRRILVSLPDNNGYPQVWIHDRASTTTRQLTFGGQNIRPVWSPNGDRVAFNTDRVPGKYYSWTMPADGSNDGERAGEGSEISGTSSVSWTRDGKWIVIDGVPDSAQVPGVGRGGGSEDIFAIPTSGQRTMRAVVATSAHEQSGEVSPDGKWIAYVSNRTGRVQVYVQPFLTPGGPTLVSEGAGNEPAWASNTELTYVNTDVDSLVVARLQFGSTVTVTRSTLFDHRPFRSGNTSTRGYDATRDGGHFVFARMVGERLQLEPIIVLNWLEEVKRLMAAAGSTK